VSSDDFTQQVLDAYEHLYDIVHLRNHPLVGEFLPAAALSARERGWGLHRLLLEAIEELDPGPQAPTFSHEWRRHRLMVLHYVDGLDPQAVADQIAISRRHYYREHEAALAAVASVLQGKRLAAAVGAPPPSAAPAAMDLLQREALRAAQATQHGRLAEIIQGVVEIIGDLAAQRGTRLLVSAGPDWGSVREDAGILRQMLLGLLSALVQSLPPGGEIRIYCQQEGDGVALWLDGREPGSATDAPVPSLEGAPELEQVRALAALQKAQIRPLAGAQGLAGFVVSLTRLRPRRVLVIDDNEDVLELFRRYLSPRYEVLTCSSGARAIQMARELRPYAITLDLMMPSQDGWDVLQTLANQPETQDLPIIVCTVLRVRDLALSLGAAAFLEKPVSQHDLLAVLDSLDAGRS
jgi:CheY-like chemotaxis protein